MKKNFRLSQYRKPRSRHYRRRGYVRQQHSPTLGHLLLGSVFKLIVNGIKIVESIRQEQITEDIDHEVVNNQKLLPNKIEKNE